MYMIIRLKASYRIQRRSLYGVALKTMTETLPANNLNTRPELGALPKIPFFD
jgi:hypothetical protein